MEKNKRDELVTVADLERALNSMFPEALQEEWDNSGMILGFYDNHVKKILTCLELDYPNSAYLFALYVNRRHSDVEWQTHYRVSAHT